MNEDVVFWAGIFILVVLTMGDPDLMDAIIFNLMN